MRQARTSTSRKKHVPARAGESGNVFFYIFICAFLLGALSYAVAQGGRSSATSLSQDRIRLAAADVIGYADTIGKAVSQLRLRGTQIDELSFANSFLPSADYGVYDDNPTAATHEIFNPAGGAVVYQDPPEIATTTGTEQYQFLSNNAVQHIGTTCATASCADLLLVIANMNREICLQINNLVGVTNPGGEPPEDADIRENEKWNPATGFGYSQTIGDEDAALSGKSEACFAETDEDPLEYVYYKVLMRQ